MLEARGVVHDVHLVGARRRPAGAASRRPLPDAAHRVGRLPGPVETEDPGDPRCLARSPPLLDGDTEGWVDRVPDQGPVAPDHQRPIARVFAGARARPKVARPMLPTSEAAGKVCGTGPGSYELLSVLCIRASRTSSPDTTPIAMRMSYRYSEDRLTDMAMRDGRIRDPREGSALH